MVNMYINNTWSVNVCKSLMHLLCCNDSYWQLVVLVKKLMTMQTSHFTYMIHISYIYIYIFLSSVAQCWRFNLHRIGADGLRGFVGPPGAPGISGKDGLPGFPGERGPPVRN